MHDFRHRDNSLVDAASAKEREIARRICARSLKATQVDIYEEAVMNCLVANGETFVVPQYDVGGGWSRPDFVALRPAKKEVYVVEVSSSGSLNGLVEKIGARQSHWLSPLKAQLERLGIASPNWGYRILVFVRSDQFSWITRAIGQPDDVTVLRLEEAFAHWNWERKVWTHTYSFEPEALNQSKQV